MMIDKRVISIKGILNSDDVDYRLEVENQIEKSASVQHVLIITEGPTDRELIKQLISQQYPNRQNIFVAFPYRGNPNGEGLFKSNDNIENVELQFSIKIGYRSISKKQTIKDICCQFRQDLQTVHNFRKLIGIIDSDFEKLLERIQDNNLETINNNSYIISTPTHDLEAYILKTLCDNQTKFYLSNKEKFDLAKTLSADIGKWLVTESVRIVNQSENRLINDFFNQLRHNRNYNVKKQLYEGLLDLYCSNSKNWKTEYIYRIFYNTRRDKTTPTNLVTSYFKGATNRGDHQNKLQKRFDKCRQNVISGKIKYNLREIDIKDFDWADLSNGHDMLCFLALLIENNICHEHLIRDKISGEFIVENFFWADVRFGEKIKTIINSISIV